MKRAVSLLIVLLIPLALVWAASGEELARKVVERLDALSGFEAHYLAQAASGRKIEIVIYYTKPNRMRMDIPSLGAITVFDGARYTYYDKERAKAVVMEAGEALTQLAAIQQLMAAIPWVGAGQGEARVPGVIYPRLDLELKPDNLDLSLEMATRPHGHSWVRALAESANPVQRGEEVVLVREDETRRTETTVNLSSGLLKSMIVTDGGEVLGSLRLQKVELKKPKESLYQFALPEGTQIRNQRDDPMLLQQLLVTTFRSSLDYVLVVAKKKWTSLSEMEKQALRRAVRQCFDKIFALSRDATSKIIQQGITAESYAQRLRRAYQNADSRRRFATDHPDLAGAALDAAWREQVVIESERAILVDLSQTIDQEIVAPIRRQVIDHTAGLDEAARKQIVLSVTEPIMQAFHEMVGPTIRETLLSVLAG